MTITIKYPLFSSVLVRALEGRDEIDHDAIAKKLGLKTSVVFAMWLAGHSLPRLTLLPALAAAIGVPHEDLLLTWLADSDRENTSSYHLLAAQLMGVDPANDLFSGERMNSSTPWVYGPFHPQSAAELVAGMEDEPPPGVFRDWDLSEGQVKTSERVPGAGGLHLRVDSKHQQDIGGDMK
jgi:hypothetical protein